MGISFIAEGLISEYAATAAVATAAAAGSYMATKSAQPKLQAPGAPPQDAKAPTDAMGTLAGMKGVGQSGGSAGIAQTYLTGPGGIDPALLNIGKATLLGG